jgi:hypothetical protein
MAASDSKETKGTAAAAGHMWAVRKISAAVGFELVQTPIPVPKANEVLLRVLACSLCGTDVHVHDWDPPFSAGRLTPPITTGNHPSFFVRILVVRVEISTHNRT